MRIAQPRADRSGTLLPPQLLQTRSTTILAVRKDGELVRIQDSICLSAAHALRPQTMVGDGQVTQGQVVIKSNTNKIRRIGDDILLGFAGSSADCLALAELLESKLEEHPGALQRAPTQQWRSALTRWEAQASLCGHASHWRRSGA